MARSWHGLGWIIGVLMLGIVPVGAQVPGTAPGPRFAVRLAPNLVSEPRPEGRLVVVIGRGDRAEPRLGIGRTDGRVDPVLGVDAAGLGPDTVIAVDATAEQFPLKSVANLPAGTYAAQAVLLTNRDLNLPDAPGNLYSEAVKFEWQPGQAATVELTLSKAVPPESVPRDTAAVKYLKLPSPKLTAFHGRPMFVRAAVVLPTDFESEPTKRYPLRVHIGGFGTRYTAAAFFAGSFRSAGAPQFVTLLLDGAGPYGDPYQVNSANHGPYGDVVTQELIPLVESKFRCIGQPHARFLDGASTGGWVSVALQVFYPDFFNGCWSDCPDPVDFRSFELINIYEDENAYVDAQGKERPAKRRVSGEVVYSVRHEVQLEVVLGRGGRWALGGKDWGSWNATFSPRGTDGLPMPLWDGKTGKIDRTVAEHWKKYDLHLVLRDQWADLGPKLNGKIRIWVGDKDEYYLNEAVQRLSLEVPKFRNPAFRGSIRISPGKGHISGGWSETQRRQEMAAAVAEHEKR